MYWQALTLTLTLACAFEIKCLTRSFHRWRTSFQAAFQSTSGAVQRLVSQNFLKLNIQSSQLGVVESLCPLRKHATDETTALKFPRSFFLQSLGFGLLYWSVSRQRNDCSTGPSPGNEGRGGQIKRLEMETLVSNKIHRFALKKSKITVLHIWNERVRALTWQIASKSWSEICLRHSYKMIRYTCTKTPLKRMLQNSY